MRHRFLRLGLEGLRLPGPGPAPISAAVARLYAVDFTSVSSLPPEISLARASAGYDFNSSGIIASFATNTPRFGYKYNGSLWVPEGLRTESQRTDSCFQSFNPSSPDWAVSNCTKTTGYADLLGGTGAALVTNSVAGGVGVAHGIYIFPVGTLNDATVYTMRVYVGRGTAPYVWFEDFNNDIHFFLGSLKWADMSVETNAASVGASIAGPFLVGRYGGVDVYAVDLTYTHEGTREGSVVVGPANTGVGAIGPDNDLHEVSDGTETCYCFGAEYQEGTFATSPILTTTTAVTRSADLLSSNAPLTALLAAGPSILEATDIATGVTSRTAYAAGAFNWPTNKLYRLLAVYAPGTNTSGFMTVGGPY